MTFAAPYWFWALALLPFLCVAFAGNEKRRKSLLQKIVASRLLSQLAGNGSPARRRLRFGILLLGLAAIITSLARPQMGYTWEESKRKGRDVMIAIDTSKSMLANDVSPSRLARAKLAAQDVISQLQGDRVGLMAFAGSAFVQAPLTVDYGAVLDTLNELDTNIIPLGGTDIAAVINEAAKNFEKSESGSRCLILFTDGDELDADGVAAAKEQAKNFRIFTVGVGSREGAIIPVPEDNGGTSFVKNQEGEIVKTKLDEARLTQIAEATGGFYTHLQNGPADMLKIIREGVEKLKEQDIDSRNSQRLIERYQWSLALGLLLVTASLFINERRRTAPVVSLKSNGIARNAALLFFAMLLMAHTASAFPQNEAIELYNSSKYKESYDAFQKQLSKNPDSQSLEFNSGAAAYKTGDYDKAIEAFGRAITSSKPEVRAKAEYNLGNALCMRGSKQQEKEAKLKDWNNALQHYDESLKVDPKNGDAGYNRDIVKKMIDELNKPPEQQQQKKDQDQKKDDSKKDDKKDQKDQQDQKNQSNDKKDQKDQSKDQQDQKKDGQQDSKKDQDQKNQDSKSGQDQKQDPKNGQQDSKNGQQDQKDDKGQGGKDSQDQKKEDPKEGDKSQNKPQNQPKDDKSQNASADKDDQKKDQSQQNSTAQNKDQKPGEQDDPKNDASNSASNSSNTPPPKPQSTPSSQQPDKKFSGQISDQQPKPGEKPDQGEQEEAYAPGQEKPMTHGQAVNVVEAEKEEEAKGVLIERKVSTPVLKDW